MGHTPLIVGMVLAVEGLAVINIFNLVISSTVSLMVIMMGLQLFCLGLLSMATFIVERGMGSYLVRRVPTFIVLVFFMLLLPAAFLIVH